MTSWRLGPATFLAFRSLAARCRDPYSVRVHLLEAGILLLQLFEATLLSSFASAMDFFPFVKRRRADLVLSADRLHAVALVVLRPGWPARLASLNLLFRIIASR